MSTKHILSTPLTKLEKIIHLADIHIRLYKRHNEYKLVFEELYNSLRARNLNNTAIVIAGDIVHAKTDMSPEMVKVTSEFLKTLADLAPTIVIAGNHDLNLANLNRLDALSPIIDNLKHKHLHYLKTSGTYEFANVEFGVHAIADSSEDWPSPDNTNVTKIGLFHGPVNKAKTDVGYTITNRVTTEAFSGYDMVLLGDIHKTQFLQEFGGRGIPEVFYVGSLIQQNHGELPEGHGYAVWDVATCKVESHVEIKNTFGYHTLKLTNSKMPDISKLPENVRLRIFVGDVDTTVVKKVQAAVRKKYNVVECTINRLVEKNTSKSSKANLDKLDNINDVNHQNSLIKEYIENNLPDVESDIIQKICEINTTLNSRIEDDDLPKNISWRPINIKFDNLFSYGSDNSINFDGMDGLYGVFSPNATGKTSAFDAVCFALYDKTPRAFKGSHIMNTRKNKFSCELTIEIGQTQYIIERTGVRKKNGEVKVDVDFFKIDGTDKISLNGEDRRDTNSIIRSYVGTYEDFVLTSLSVQGQNSLFIETGQSDRKDLLSQFIGLTVFDRLYNLGSDEIKELVGSLKSFKRDDFTQNLADAQTYIDSNKTLLDTAQRDIEELTLQSNKFGTKIKSLYEQKMPISVTFDFSDEDHILQSITDNVSLVANLEDEVKNRTESINKLRADRLILLEKYPKETVQDLTNKFQEITAARSSLQKLQSELKLLRLEASNKREKLEKLKEHKYDPNCQYCINNVFVRDAEVTRSVYDSLLQKIDSYEDKLSGADAYITARIQSEEDYKNIVLIQTDLSAIEKNIQELVIKNSSVEAEISLLNINTQQLYAMQELFVQNKTSIQENARIQTEIEKLEGIVESLNKEIHRLQKNLRDHDLNISMYTKIKDDMLKNIKDAEELETTYEAYETYLSVIGRDGLPYSLISNVIPTLQAEVNNILSQMVDFTISLEVDGKNINGKIIYDDNRNWPLELASGMEKFISGLSIRVALMSVSNLPKSNFLVMDEGLGVLDSDNLTSMSILFDILKSQFDFIILISHLDVVRDITDNLIDIQQIDGFSSINHP